jgi:N-methylhydantoinase A
MAWRLGVDIGGTFTDLCAYDEVRGALHTLKVLSQPDRPGTDVGTALEELGRRHQVDLTAVGRFTHGTTVGVNTIIERRGAVLALFVTAGFTDVLELARLRMPDAYSLFGERPPPLVPRDRVFPVIERMAADGTALTPVDRASVAAAVAAARAKGCDGAVIALLHAWREPAHEIEVARIIAALAPELFVFRSTEVWPAIREYERTSTAVLNAYVHPQVARYLERLEATLRGLGVPAPALITRSNGGVMTARQGRRDCVGMLLSGTACGVMGAAFVAAQAGLRDAVTLDVGGTSADIALLLGGAVQFAAGETVGGFPLFIPSVAVSSIGAGGGSIAHVDAFGVLKVGPDSAGSVPGPACYGRGGLLPTLTDAYVARGILGHAALGFGAVQPDADAARRAVASLAERIGRPVEATAEAIEAVAVSAMYLETSKLFARNAVDLGNLTLIAFGGAGPMVGCALARELGVRRVLVPRAPGVLCAVGGLVAEVRNDLLRTVMLPLESAVLPGLRAEFARLEQGARHWLAEVGSAESVAIVQLAADMRYHGQSYEIEVPLDAAMIAGDDPAALAEAFHARHQAVFDHADRQAPVEIVNLRLAIRAEAPALNLPQLRGPAHKANAARIAIFIHGAWDEVPLLMRAALAPGQIIDGPAVIAQEDATVLLPRNTIASTDAHGHLMIELG